MTKEVNEALKYFDRIVIYPLEKYPHEQRTLSEKCEVSNILADKEFQQVKKNWGQTLTIYFSEVFKSGKPLFLIRNFKSIVRNISQCSARAALLHSDFKKRELKNPCFYSVWMDDGATTLGILKRKSLIDNYVFRLHGYDLFDERRKGNYMPFRHFNFKLANRIFVLSKTGLDYIKAKNIYPEKLVMNYSGLYDHGAGPFVEENKFTLVSCSNLYKFKRVDKILEALKKIDFPIHWKHIGAGDEYENLKARLTELPSNVTVDFEGKLDNAELIEYYKNNHVNLFIHLSETEGLGMAAVEAQSFGIPAISLDVGGVKEVVNDKTGILLNANASIDEIAKHIQEFKDSNMNTKAFRAEVRKYFLENFKAEENYQFFFDEMIQSCS